MIRSGSGAAAILSASRQRAAGLVAIVVLVASILTASGAFAPAPRPVSTGRLPIHALASADASPATTAPVADLVAASQLQPGIQYEDAVAHEHDRIDFTPGGRVTKGYSPRQGDGWSVGGHAPRALPAGNASGREIAASPQGSRWAVRAPGAAAPHPAPSAAPAPIDGPTVDAANVIPADAASAVARDMTAAAAPTNAGLIRQVFGFLPYWELTDSSTTLNYDVLSTIAYFSVGADANGNLQKRNADGTATTGWAGFSSSKMTSVINAAHSHRTRVVLTISVFAWTSTQASKQAALLGSSTARLNLARQAAAAVRDRGVDGINLDFEPIASGQAANFTALVRTMRAELNRIALGYQLTFDTTGYIGNYPIEAATASGGADAIFIMGYDYRTAGSSTVGSIAPLTGPVYDLTDTIKAYAARVPASKLILGVPYYGRAWSTATTALHSKNTSGTKFGASTTVVYTTAAEYAAQYGRKYDSIEQSPYVVYQRENCTATYGCVTSPRQIYYDDATSLAAKYDVVNHYALRGAGMWALGYDGTRPELYRVLAAKFLHDTTPPTVGIRTLPAKQRDQGFVVSWRGEDISGIASYDVQRSIDGGTWAGWLSATTRTSGTWLGQAGHGYAFRVRARDTKGNLSGWNVASVWRAAPPLAVAAFGGVKSDNLSMRAAPHTSATKIGELSVGDIVSVVGGPVSADGYTWWQVSGPLREWHAVSDIDIGFWVAAGDGVDTWLGASRAPNSTVVDPVIANLVVGDSSRSFSPNGDGYRDSIRIRWTNTVALDTIVLKVFRSTGVLVGTITLPNTALGSQSFDWNGMVGGTRVADGTYLAELVGKAGTTTYAAPSNQPPTAQQLAAFGITVDTVAPIAANAVSWSPGLFFPQDGDTYAATSKVTFKLTRASRVTVRIYDAAGHY
ncbi:MAG TPA: glycosyl hydrolase family 18 protein, partial [Candidatus Limnocylindrales bacterium]|nr:glycosyl hydrolase family 18 protein [Candidatus Limnocylindrales bacterium]